MFFCRPYVNIHHVFMHYVIIHNVNIHNSFIIQKLFNYKFENTALFDIKVIVIPRDAIKNINASHNPWFPIN